MPTLLVAIKSAPVERSPLSGGSGTGAKSTNAAFTCSPMMRNTMLLMGWNTSLRKTSSQLRSILSRVWLSTRKCELVSPLSRCHLPSNPNEAILTDERAAMELREERRRQERAAAEARRQMRQSQQASRSQLPTATTARSQHQRGGEPSRSQPG